MANITIDLTNYRDRVGQRVPEGRYLVRVQDVELTTAKSGAKMVNLFLDVASGPFAGSSLVDRLVLTEKALFRVVNFMQAIGMQTPKKRLSINTAMFVGKLLEADVADGEPWNGNVRSEIRGYVRTSSADEDSADLGDDADDLPEDLEYDEDDTETDDGEEFEDVEDEPEPEPAPVKRQRPKVIRTKAAAKPAPSAKVQEEPADDEDMADDDDDELSLDDLPF